MSLLLDTHVIRWFLANDPKLSTAARSAILDPANVRWVSPIRARPAIFSEDGFAIRPLFGRIANPSSEVILGQLLSLLEIAIKHRLGKLPLPLPFAAIFPSLLLASDTHLLPLEADHIEPLTRLPLHHRDPFDRLIAATALVEGLTLISADLIFDSYGLTRLW